MSHFLYHYLFHGDKSATKVEHDESSKVSNELTEWRHLDLNNAESLQWLHYEANIDSAVIESFVAEETRPRAVFTERGIMVVLRGVNFNLGADPEDMVSLRLWIEPNRVISARVRALNSIENMVNAIDQGDAPRSAGEFLTRVVERLANRIGDYINRLEDELGDTENQLEQLKLEDFRNALSALRRQLAAVRRFLGPQRDALDRLYLEGHEVLNARDQQRLRDESDRFSRYLEDLDLAREHAMLLHEAFTGHMAQQQNSRMYVLSIVAAIFLPLTFITGLLGMNVGGLPLLSNAHGFAIAAALMGFGALGLALFFKLKKWF